MFPKGKGNGNENKKSFNTHTQNNPNYLMELHSVENIPRLFYYKNVLKAPVTMGNSNSAKWHIKLVSHSPAPM